MALDKTTYKAAIKAAFLAAKAEANPTNFDAAMDALAAALSDAGDAFVKSGTVNTSGLPTSDGASVTSDTNVT